MITQANATSLLQAASVQLPSKPAGEGGQAALSAQIAARQLRQDGLKTSASSSVQQQLTTEEFKRASEELQRRIQVVAPELQFSVDHDSGRTIIKVTDPATNEIIRQIPSEEVLALNKELDRFQSLLLSHKV